MSFSVGIVGLPNVGKSTLFKALTKKPVDIAVYPFTTIHPNVGIVTVPDERLEKIANLIKPEKITHTIIEFVDIAGLIKDAHKGEGLGNQFLSQIRNCDAIVEVIRCFEAENIENILGEISPEKEIGVIKTELLMKDWEILEGIIQKIEKDVKKDKKFLKEFELLKKVREGISRGKSVSELSLIEEEMSEIKKYQLLTEKPTLFIINESEKASCPKPNFDCLIINLKDEEDISDLSEEELKELNLKSHLDQLIINCYNALDLITFFTVAGGKETRALTVKRGTKIPEAGGKVHTDFKEKFIRAEVISWKSFVEAGSWTKAKESGSIKTVGKDYIVQNGEIIEFKI